MNRDPDCLFCKIAGHEIDAKYVRESDGVVAFEDINPVAPTHILLIPKDHVGSAAELSRTHGEVLGEIFETSAAIAAERGLDSYRIVTNIGPGAGQSVFHLHFHLLGGRRMTWPPG